MKKNETRWSGRLGERNRCIPRNLSFCNSRQTVRHLHSAIVAEEVENCERNCSLLSRLIVGARFVLVGAFICQDQQLHAFKQWQLCASRRQRQSPGVAARRNDVDQHDMCQTLDRTPVTTGIHRQYPSVHHSWITVEAFAFFFWKYCMYSGTYRFSKRDIDMAHCPEEHARKATYGVRVCLVVSTSVLTERFSSRLQLKARVASSWAN